MQRSVFTGSRIAVEGADRFEDRMRRITDEVLEAASRHAEHGRISGWKVPWFALRVWTGREKAVENHLAAIGILSLVPMRKGPDLRRRHRVIEGAMMPVIHGYVLVQMMAEAAYLGGLQRVENVIGVLGGCERPMRIGDQEVNRFNALACGGAYDWERPVGLTLTAGERVLVVDGPFTGRTALVVTPNRKGRGDAVVSFSFMGGEVPVTMPLALLQKL